MIAQINRTKYKIEALVFKSGGVYRESVRSFWKDLELNLEICPQASHP